MFLAKQGSMSDDHGHLTHTCLGADCFRDSHLIEVALAATGCISLLVLSCKVSPLYRNRWAHEDADKRRQQALN